MVRAVPGSSQAPPARTSPVPSQQVALTLARCELEAGFAVHSRQAALQYPWMEGRGQTLVAEVQPGDIWGVAAFPQGVLLQPRGSALGS